MNITEDWKQQLAGRFGEELQQLASQPEEESNDTATTPAARKGKLRVELDKHGRKGKPATLITEFQGDEQELKRLTKMLQSKLGVGGSHCFNSEEPYDGQILLQGDCRTKAVALLEKEGYKCRLIGK